MVSLYWKNHGKPKRIASWKTFQRSDVLGCAECCTKMITQVDCDATTVTLALTVWNGQNASCLPVYEEDPRERGDPQNIRGSDNEAAQRVRI